MNSMRHLFLTWLLLLILPLSAAAQSYRDDLGRVIDLPQPPQRIVSLAPSVTETLFALGAQASLVGVTRQCDYPPAAQALPLVGDYTAPSLEAIAALQPQLVVLNAAAGSPQLLTSLERLGVKVYIVQPLDLAGVRHLFRQLGAMVQRPEAAAGLVRQLDEALAAVRRPVTAASPRVLFLASTRPLMVAGPQTLPGELLAAVGARNPVPAGTARYPTWTEEALLLTDPDIILAVRGMGETDPAAWVGQWPVLRAVQRQRVQLLEPDLVFRPGPRLAAGLRAVARAVWGEARP